MENIEDKLIIAKLMDKIKLCKTRNKIVNTEFLSMYQREIIQKELNRQKIKNYLFFGGYDEADGQILIIYPDKLDLQIIENNLKEIIKAIEIKLPKEQVGEYNHRDYLGIVMKAGLNRNRIGDIIVHPDSAYIFVLNENAEYIKNILKEFSRFNKAEIEIINYNNVKLKKQEYEEIKISVSSMRLDNVISEIIKLSRNKVDELFLQEKIFLNSKLEKKNSKIINEKDILAIRGYGKYLVDEFIGNNKKGKNIVQIKKYK